MVSSFALSTEICLTRKSITKSITLLLLVIVAFKVQTALATPQLKDTFTYQNHVVQLFEENDFLTLAEEIKTKWERNYHRRDSWCTANWRGYLVHWKISSKRLYVSSITKECGKEEISNNFFPEQTLPIPAVWYSGSFYIANLGELAKKITIKKGNIIKVETSKKRAVRLSESFLGFSNIRLLSPKEIIKVRLLDKP